MHSLSSNIRIFRERIGIALKRITFIIGFVLISGMLVAQDISLRGRWRFHIGDEAAWAEKDFDDSNWEQVWVPSAWEDEGFNGYDGFAWYRIKFDGRKLDREGVYYLNLGFIDDADEAFLNEKLIGFSGQCPPKFKTAYNNERRYVLPSQLVNFDGENTLAVRVFDGMHRGGIVDGKVGIYQVNVAKLLVDLQGIWSFAKSPSSERVTDNAKWEKIMVPGPWENQGHQRYDGFAWYKRTFNISAKFPKEPVVLMVGKIDDFDKVYFNGKLIGSTNDHREYGRSSSYDQTRIYEIPQDIIKRNGSNTVEILVEDMGNIGGIYEGVIGITTKANYERYFK
jgi:hypothetical protein